MEQKELRDYTSTNANSIRDNFDDIYYPQDILELISKNTDQKMIDFIRSANRDYLDTVVLRYMGLQFTYRELFDRVEEYARALKQFGLNKGDYITICLPNSPETVFYFYACNEIGVTPYLIDPRYTIGKMAVCISDSKSKLFICEMGTYYSKVAAHEDQLVVNRIVIVSPLSSFDNRKLSAKQFIVKQLYNIKSRRQQKSIPCATKSIFHHAFIAEGKKFTGTVRSEYDSSVPAIVVNTSGTSGESVKGAVHSNKSYNILANQTTFISKDICRGYTYYGYIPYFTMYGSGVGLHTGISHGVIVDNIPKFNGKKSIIEIIKMKTNILIGVPSLFESLTQMCNKKHVDMSFAKLYVMGGDNISPEKLEKENRILSGHGMKNKITYGYGTTEVMMINTTSDDERSYVYGSCGIPYPGVKYKIINPDSLEELNNGIEGEIYIHTKTLMDGYLNKPEENNMVFALIDGIKYFRTGDKGYITTTGHLYLTGRYKRLMKRPDGHQVSPIPIENAIAKQLEVVNCCVVGLKKNNEEIGVIPTAFLQLKKDIVADEKQITKIANEALKQLSGEREAALAFIVIEKIPYTENGKMDYRSLELKGFPDNEFYIVDDPITRSSFKGMKNAVMIKVN